MSFWLALAVLISTAGLTAPEPADSRSAASSHRRFDRRRRERRTGTKAGQFMSCSMRWPPVAGRSSRRRGPSTLTAIATCAPVAPRVINPSIPDELERIIAKALEKKPALRYQTASDLRADLQRLKRDLEAHPTEALPFQPAQVSRAPGLRWWAGGAVAILVLTGAGWLFVAARTRSSIGLPDGPVARHRFQWHGWCRQHRSSSVRVARWARHVPPPTGRNGCPRRRPSTSSPLPGGRSTCVFTTRRS